mmetsp:Transcript_47103/g.150983  ORF Transcript_47103/g.150983 Transcript_47103/m.150983 type:complete len:206 (+) Transcript_47103:94-711(+)
MSFSLLSARSSSCASSSFLRLLISASRRCTSLATREEYSAMRALMLAWSSAVPLPCATASQRARRASLAGCALFTLVIAAAIAEPSAVYRGSFASTAGGPDLGDLVPPPLSESLITSICPWLPNTLRSSHTPTRRCSFWRVASSVASTLRAWGRTRMNSLTNSGPFLRLFWRMSLARYTKASWRADGDLWNSLIHVLTTAPLSER